MNAQPGDVVGWEEVLREIRLLRRDVGRTEEQMWQVMEDMHEVLRGRGADKTGNNGRGDTGPREKSDRREYRLLKRAFRRLLERTLPEGSRAAVVSRGDADLLDLPGLAGEHFPRTRGGEYAGFYPNDGTAAIAHLEWVRSAGAEYLVLPSTSRWWLDSFPRFTAHLRGRFPLEVDETGVGLIFRLEPREDGSASWLDQVAHVLDAWELHAGETPALLDWTGGSDLASRLPGRSVFDPPVDGDHLPYIDRTIDVVAVDEGDPRRLAEARRVARRSLLRLSGTSHQGGLPLLSGEPSEPTLTVEHLDGPPPEPPSVSIVVPTYNGIIHLRPCLRALRETLPPNFRGEVLVVDDGSGPETVRGLRELERDLPWLTVLRNETNLGFIGSCNRGADEAWGDILVFLNDDTVPLPGWLSALIRTFQGHPDAGAVGGRLLYPDGRLQEAGCLLYRDGTGANVGRDDQKPDAPLYRYLRPVDYCSGALLATPRELFRSLGGFDTRYRPAYYEDSDYCLTVQAEGHRVYYQPEAAIVHAEGATSGTDPSSGVKRYQVRNHGKFLKKWGAELKRRPDPPGEYSAVVWHRLALAGGAR